MAVWLLPCLSQRKASRGGLCLAAAFPPAALVSLSEADNPPLSRCGGPVQDYQLPGLDSSVSTRRAQGLSSFQHPPPQHVLLRLQLIPHSTGRGVKIGDCELAVTARLPTHCQANRMVWTSSGPSMTSRKLSSPRESKASPAGPQVGTLWPSQTCSDDACLPLSTGLSGPEGVPFLKRWCLDDLLSTWLGTLCVCPLRAQF